MELTEDKRKISWTMVERETANDFGYRLEHVSSLRKQFFESEGMDVLVFGDDTNDENKLGAANSNQNNNKKTVCICHLLAILEYVDLSHSLRKGLTL